MSRLGFLHADCWLDDDGQHVWLRHECVDGYQDTMLPWPNWSVAASGDGRTVQPSIQCAACGLHFIATIGRQPQTTG